MAGRDTAWPSDVSTQQGRALLFALTTEQCFSDCGWKQPHLGTRRNAQAKVPPRSTASETLQVRGGVGQHVVFQQALQGGLVLSQV